jgi:hypothetical protein
LSEYASIDDLTSASEPETRDVTLPDGKVVKVRGLTRIELLLSTKGTDDTALVERRNVATCLVEPRMTVQQVEAWQKRPGSVLAIGEVTDAIRDLSGLGEGAAKSDPGTAGE